MAMYEKAKQRRVEMAKTAPFLHLLSVEDRERFLRGEIKIAEKAKFYCEKCEKYYIKSINDYKRGHRCPCERYIKSAKSRMQWGVNNTPKEVISAMHPDDRERFLKCEIKNKITTIKLIYNSPWHKYEIDTYKIK